jgi:diguanylate cyclase (GGDEF)-like protein/PAS domain S-box-containing protein
LPAAFAVFMQAFIHPGFAYPVLAAVSRQFLELAFMQFPGREFHLHAVTMAVFFGLSALMGAAIGHFCRVRWPFWRRRNAPPSELTMLRAVVDSLPDTIFVKDTQSRFLFANPATARVMGAAGGAELLGKTDFDFYPQENALGFFTDEQKILNLGQPQLSKEEINQTPNGDTQYFLTTKVPMYDHAGRAIGLMGIGRNITARKAVEEQLEHVRDELAFKASHDSLTSLSNRAAILDLLDGELARSIRQRSGTAVLLADLDHFKAINDEFGHLTGDEVLREVASRLMNGVRAYDRVGRYGGEEFLIVLPGCSATKDAVARAENLRLSMAASPICTGCGLIPITLSMGVLVTSEWRHINAVDVLREVDAALYAAKDAGRNCCCLAASSKLSMAG